MRYSPKFFIPLGALCALTLVTLEGCAPLVVAGIAGGGAAATLARQDQGLSGAIRDKTIKADIKANLMNAQENHDLYNRVDVNVLEGNVLLTGYVPDEASRKKVVNLVDIVNGVRTMFDEMHIGAEQGFGNGASDTWISTKIRTELIFQQDVKSPNFLVHTTDGVVYLMGVAQSEKELQDTLLVIGSTSGVKKIVDLTRFKNDPLPPARDIKPLSQAEEYKIKAAKVPVEKKTSTTRLAPDSLSQEDISTRPLDASDGIVAYPLSSPSPSPSY